MSAFFALTETLLWENRHSNRLSQKGGILGSQPLKRKHLDFPNVRSGISGKYRDLPHFLAIIHSKMNFSAHQIHATRVAKSPTKRASCGTCGSACNEKCTTPVTQACGQAALDCNIRRCTRLFFVDCKNEKRKKTLVL
jgi:hypothetical protein